MSGKLVVVLILVIMIFVSAISVVYVKHYHRKLFVSLQNLEQQRDEMEVEWGRLQLEQGSLTTHARMERIARKQMKMVIPASSEVVYIHL